MDIHFLSYPGSGRNWMTLMIGKYFESYFGLELLSTGHLLRPEGFKKLDGRAPQFWFSHDDRPYLQTVEKITTALKLHYVGHKVVLIVRDPRDAIISCYHKHRFNPKFVFGSMKQFTGTLSEYLRDDHHGIAGAVAWMNVWAKGQDIPAGFLMVRYEDLNSDVTRELVRVINFIDGELLQERCLDEAVEFAGFDNFRQLERAGIFNTGIQRGEERSLLTRAGKAGGYQQTLDARDLAFTAEAVRRLDPMYGYI